MTDASFPVKRLDKIEFAAALRKGQGRAMLHVLHYGLEDVEGLILEACLHNQVYDQQLESIRGDWLFSMIRNSLNFAKFREVILKVLQTETEFYNVF